MYEIRWQSVVPIESYDQFENLLDFIFFKEKIDFCYISLQIGGRLFRQFISLSAWNSISDQMRQSMFRDVDKVVAIGLNDETLANKLVDSIEKAIIWQALTS